MTKDEFLRQVEIGLLYADQEEIKRENLANFLASHLWGYLAMAPEPKIKVCYNCNDRKFVSVKHTYDKEYDSMPCFVCNADSNAPTVSSKSREYNYLRDKTRTGMLSMILHCAILTNAEEEALINIPQNRELFLSALRSREYPKGPIEVDDKGHPIDPNAEGYCAAGLAYELFHNDSIPGSPLPMRLALD